MASPEFSSGVSCGIVTRGDSLPTTALVIPSGTPCGLDSAGSV